MPTRYPAIPRHWSAAVIALVLSGPRAVVTGAVFLVEGALDVATGGSIGGEVHRATFAEIAAER